MPKSRSRKYGRSKKSSKNGIRMVTSGVKNVGSTVLNVGKKATPVVEKGVGVIYDTLSSGFNLGVKRIKKGINFVSQKSKKKRSKKSRKNKSRRH